MHIEESTKEEIIDVRKNYTIIAAVGILLLLIGLTLIKEILKKKKLRLGSSLVVQQEDEVELSIKQ